MRINDFITAGISSGRQILDVFSKATWCTKVKFLEKGKKDLLMTPWWLLIQSLQKIIVFFLKNYV